MKARIVLLYYSFLNLLFSISGFLYLRCSSRGPEDYRGKKTGRGGAKKNRCWVGQTATGGGKTHSAQGRRETAEVGSQEEKGCGKKEKGGGREEGCGVEEEEAGREEARRGQEETRRKRTEGVPEGAWETGLIELINFAVFCNIAVSNY